jgi:hypothetical protein
VCSRHFGARYQWGRGINAWVPDTSANPELSGKTP